MTLSGSRLRWMAAVVLAAAIAADSRPSFATRAAPVDATVFVRLVGRVKVLRGEDERAWREQLLDLKEVEIGTGSGFIISPHGWVVTNHHVISGEKTTMVARGEKLEVSIDVSRIEVVLPPDKAGQAARRFDASVYAADPELDLALLRVNATDLPYLGLGDSDVVVAGEPVTAVGYPFGRMLDLENPDKADAVPNPSVSTGGISAVRSDQGGERRYLQVSAALNPGNSGGPVVDAEGYAVGVAQSRVTNATAIGFAVPINRVKGLLQKYGLDSNLPIELLVSGGSISNPSKGVSVRVPGGFEDRSPSRLRVEATTGGLPAHTVATSNGGSSEHLALRIDRVATAQSIEQLERALLTEGGFEQFHAAGDARRLATRPDGGRRVLAGHASGTDATGDPLKIVYAIVDLGREKIVARYAGSADTIAANRSLLHASLADLELAPLLTAEVSRVVRPQWDAEPRAAAGEAGVPTLAGWLVEPGLPWQCAAGFPAPSTGFSMSPAGDFTVALRAAWYDVPMKDVRPLARRCAPRPGAAGEDSYVTQATAWGVAYHVEGIFLTRPDNGVWQLELIAPADKARFLGGVFGDWIKTFGR